MIKLKIIVFAIFVLVFQSRSLSVIVYAQTPAELVACVVEAVPYSYSSECRYTSLNHPYDYYDSCYQKYLQRKKDWETRCFRYWDEQNAKAKSNQPTVTPSSVGPKSETEELNRKLKETEDKLNILLTQTAQPKAANYNSAPRIGIENTYDLLPYITPQPVDNNSSVSGEMITVVPTITPTIALTPTTTPSLIQSITIPILSFFESLFSFFKR